MDLEFEEISVGDGLSSVVKTFFTIKYEESATRVDYLLPNGTPSFFYLKAEEGIDMRCHGTGEWVHLEQGWHAGYISKLFEYKHCAMHIIGASMSPIFIATMSSIPAKELLNSFIRLDPATFCVNPPAGLLVDFKTSEVLAYMQELIAKQVGCLRFRSGFDDLFVELTNPGGYKLSLDVMAERLDCSRRYLSTLFKKYTGLSPKQFLKIARFNEALRLIDQMGKDDGFSAIAYGLGYHDQAHFIRDFKSICGKTPRELTLKSDSLANKFRYYK